MHLRLPIVFGLCAAALNAQLGSPRPGFFHAPGRPVQTLYGIPGNLVPGPAPFGPVSAISFSDEGGLVAHNGRIELVRPDGRPIAAYESDEPLPLLNIDRDLSSAIAWLPQNHAALWFDRQSFVLAPIHDEAFIGTATSVWLETSHMAHFIVLHSDNTVSVVKVDLSNGEVVSSDFLPGVRGPAFAFGTSLLWTDEGGLHIEVSPGSENVLLFPPGPFTAARMSSGWIHLSSLSTGNQYALHLDAHEPTLSRIPGRVAGRQ